MLSFNRRSSVEAGRRSRVGSRGFSTALMAALVILSAPAVADSGVGLRVQLAGRVVLPAETFRKGPDCGREIEAANGIHPPFAGRQPIQGFSDLDAGPDGEFWVLSDNGFGSKENSADYLLCIYRVSCDFSEGSMQLQQVIQLSDPNHLAGFPLVSGREGNSRASGGRDARIREQSFLTGADFDPESIVRTKEGEFWVGDEFGPFLLHFDSQGRLLVPPVPTPGVAVPENPFLGDRRPNQPSSGGFEGMDKTADGGFLYALLEKTTEGDPPGLLRLYRFDPAIGAFSGDGPYRFYPLEVKHGHYIGALAVVSPRTIAVLERDNEQGPAAHFKKIYLADLDDHEEGVLRKRELADLLKIPDPEGIGAGVEGNRGAGSFAMPFITLEGLVKTPGGFLAVCNDNNYPFSVGRHIEEGSPDDNEIILLRLLSD